MSEKYKIRLLGTGGQLVALLAKAERPDGVIKYRGQEFVEIRPGVYFNAAAKPDAEKKASRPWWKVWS